MNVRRWGKRMPCVTRIEMNTERPASRSSTNDFGPLTCRSSMMAMNQSQLFDELQLPQQQQRALHFQRIRDLYRQISEERLRYWEQLLEEDLMEHRLLHPMPVPYPEYYTLGLNIDGPGPMHAPAIPHGVCDESDSDESHSDDSDSDDSDSDESDSDESRSSMRAMNQSQLSDELRLPLQQEHARHFQRIRDLYRQMHEVRLRYLERMLELELELMDGLLNPMRVPYPEYCTPGSNIDGPVPMHAPAIPHSVYNSDESDFDESDSDESESATSQESWQN